MKTQNGDSFKTKTKRNRILPKNVVLGEAGGARCAMKCARLALSSGVPSADSALFEAVTLSEVSHGTSSCTVFVFANARRYGSCFVNR